MEDEVLQRLDETSLHVTGFSSFNGSVDKTLATALKENEV
jgi:hypothetical protein